MTLTDLTPLASWSPTSKKVARRGHPLTIDQALSVTQVEHVDGDLLPAGQTPGDTHQAAARGQSHDHPANEQATPTATALGGSSSADHDRADTQAARVGGSPPHPPGDRRADTHSRSAGWVELRIVADLFNRAQVEQIAVTNVCRPASDGGNIDAEWFAALIAMLEAVEHQAKLMLGRCFKRVVPAEIKEWQKANPGVGLHLLARLLGDPYIATPHYWQGKGANRVLMVEEPRPRTVGQLWQLAGHGAPARRTKGMTADELAAQGNPRLKMLVHLIAEACMKTTGGSYVPTKGKNAGKTITPGRSPYRDVYEAAKAAVADKAHTVECVRCGPSGKPAQPGSPWNPGHQDAHALRIVGKEILRDLWLISRTTSPPPRPERTPYATRGGESSEGKQR